MKKQIVTEKAPAAVGAYSQGVAASGLVFVSGQLPIDPATGQMPETAAEQAQRSMENVKAIVEAAGLSMDNVVKTTILLADIGDFAEVNEVYAGFFSGVCPARACYAVKDIPKGAKVEIEAIAAE